MRNTNGVWIKPTRPPKMGERERALRQVVERHEKGLEKALRQLREHLVFKDSEDTGRKVKVYGRVRGIMRELDFRDGEDTSSRQ
jgi:hypothetical protein